MRAAAIHAFSPRRSKISVLLRKRKFEITLRGVTFFFFSKIGACVRLLWRFSGVKGV